MAVSVTATIQLIFQIVLGIDSTNSPAGGDSTTQTLDGYNKTVQLNSETTPAADIEPVDLSRTLASATETEDLTSCSAARDVVEIPDYDLTGKNLVGYILRADSANNASGVTIGPNAANGYPLFGTGNDLQLLPGESVAMILDGVASARPDVAAGAKDIDISGTVGDQVDILLLFGT